MGVSKVHVDLRLYSCVKVSSATKSLSTFIVANLPGETIHYVGVGTRPLCDFQGALIQRLRL